MTVPDLPPQISAQQLARLRHLGQQVADIFASVGLPVDYHPDPAGAPTPTSGAHIRIDLYTPLLCVYWEVEDELVRRSLAATDRGDFTAPDVRLKVGATFAMGEAIRKILSEAGYETGTGSDMSPSAIWVKPNADANP